MIEVQLRIEDVGREEGELARRLLQDLNDSRGLQGAQLVRRPAAGDEKGLIEVAGSLVVTILNGSGVEALVEVVKALRPKPGSRKVTVTFPDGTMFNVEGDMSESQFTKYADAALELAGRGGST